MVAYGYQCRYQTFDFEKTKDVKKWWMSKNKRMFQLCCYVGITTYVFFE